MNFTQTIKKIFAVGTGTTLMGTTILGASAVADLGNYPAPFVQDGRFNAIIAVGDNAAAADVIAASDIVQALQFESKTAVGVSGGSATGSASTGDTWKVGTSSNDLELTETIRSVISSIGDDNELVVLEKNDFRVGGTVYEYEQRIEFGDTLKVEYVENTDDDVLGTYLTAIDGETPCDLCP